MKEIEDFKKVVPGGNGVKHFSDICARIQAVNSPSQGG